VIDLDDWKKFHKRMTAMLPKETMSKLNRIKTINAMNFDKDFKSVDLSAISS
jgi:hypothetical protein